MSSVLERLDSFCYPVSNFLVSRSMSDVKIASYLTKLCVLSMLSDHQNYTHTCTQWTDESTSCSYYVGNRTSCHDEVDFSLCFEDAAILYGICAIFWVLAGLSFFRGNGLRPRLDFGVLHASKLVCYLARVKPQEVI